MKRLAQFPVTTCFLACLFAGGGLLAVDECRRYSFPGIKPAARMEGWDCQDVISHLHAAGLDYQVVSSSENGPCSQSVFLTKTERRWAELNITPKVREHIDAWHGTVYCERVATPVQRREQLQEWGDCCIQVGSFIFFGDREMLAEIELSLARSCASDHQAS